MAARSFRALKPCYIRTFEGQERPQYYRQNATVPFDLEFPRDEEGKELIPPYLSEIGGAPERPTEATPQAISESSRRMVVQRAVSKLNREEDDDWTGEGRPAVHAVNSLAGDPNPTVTRSEISVYCPTEMRT